MTHDLPVIALTMGDCTGIGPEQVAKVMSDGRTRSVARIVVVGDARVLAQGKAHAGTSFTTRSYLTPAEIDWDDPSVPFIDLGNTDPALYPIGQSSAESGFVTGETLKLVIEMATGGQIDGICFAPLNKRAMFDGGWKFPDEHKMFAHVLAHKGYFSEMNVLDGQWMSRVTSHVSLREALDQINEHAIKVAIELATATMRKAGISNPRLAVAALNPHGGERGLFGREEIELIGPVVAEMAAKGFNVKGPYPADTVYLKAFAGDFDGVVAMYHDQGQIATKLRGFNRGVTVTAGLDLVFTTPAHGTAFDIVGTGVANTGALEAAIKLNAQLAAARLVYA